MKLRFVLCLTLVAITAFAIGTRVNGQPDDTPRQASIGLTGYPVFFVASTRPDSPTEKAGMKMGDLVISINNHEITSPQALAESMAQVRPGQTVDKRLKLNICATAWKITSTASTQ
jgi:S1-C subfamily serine protease